MSDTKTAYAKFKYNIGNNNKFNINITDFYKENDINVNNGIRVNITEKNGLIDDINTPEIINYLKDDTMYNNNNTAVANYNDNDNNNTAVTNYNDNDNNTAVANYNDNDNNNTAVSNYSNNILNDNDNNLKSIKNNIELNVNNLSKYISEFIKKIYNNVINERNSITKIINFIQEKLKKEKNTDIMNKKMIILEKIIQVINEPFDNRLKNEFEMNITASFSKIIEHYSIDGINGLSKKIIFEKIYKKLNNEYSNLNKSFIYYFKIVITKILDSIEERKNDNRINILLDNITNYNIFKQSFTHLESEIINIINNYDRYDKKKRFYGGKNKTKKRGYKTKMKKTRKVI